MATPKKKKVEKKPAAKKRVAVRAPVKKKPVAKPQSAKKLAKPGTRQAPTNVRAKKVVRVALTGVRAKAASAKALTADELLKKGKERGYITYSEILKSFPNIEEDIDFFDSLYERFVVAGVDVLEGGILEDNADEYLATRNIKDRQSTGYDSIQIYLREIGQYPLLTASEERELAKRIEKGDNEARNILARSNLRLVVSIA